MRLINIKVEGATQIGKSHVMTIIEKALKREYGKDMQVCSYDLSVERNGCNDEDMLRPSPSKVIFNLVEQPNTK